MSLLAPFLDLPMSYRLDWLVEEETKGALDALHGRVTRLSFNYHPRPIPILDEGLEGSFP